MFFIFLSSVLACAADDFNDADYQRRLNSLKESQAQTQVYLNRLTGFSSAPSDRGTLDEENSRSKRPLIQTHGDFRFNRIKTGTTLRGHNVNKLVVGGEESPAIVELDDNQSIFSGLRLLADARPSGTEGRIHLTVSRLVLKTGKVVPIQAVALDSTGAQGLVAQVFSSKALAVTGSLAASFVAGVAAAKQTQTTNVFGFQQNQQSGRNAILGGVAQTAADQSKRLIEEATSEKPVLVLEAGTPIVVFLKEEVRF